MVVPSPVVKVNGRTGPERNQKYRTHYKDSGFSLYSEEEKFTLVSSGTRSVKGKGRRKFR